MLFDRFFLLCPYSFPLLFELWAPEWSVGAHSLTNRCTRRHQDYGPQLCYPAALSRCYPVTLLNGQQAPVGRRVPTDSLGTSAVFRSHPPPSVRRAPGGTSLVLQTGYLFECPSLMVSPLTKTGTTIVEGQAVSGDPLTSLRPPLAALRQRSRPGRRRRTLSVLCTPPPSGRGCSPRPPPLFPPTTLPDWSPTSCVPPITLSLTPSVPPRATNFHASTPARHQRRPSSPPTSPSATTPLEQTLGRGSHPPHPPPSVLDVPFTHTASGQLSWKRGDRLTTVLTGGG